MTTGFDPDWVVAPGETLNEWFKENGLTGTALQAAIAKRYSISERTLRGVLAGETPIRPRLAARLAAMTMVSSAFWLGLEHNYRVGLAAGKRRMP